MKSKSLILNLKKEYFQEIIKGTKKEEYREIKPYWVKRLEGREYENIIIKCGYPKKNDREKEITFKWNGYTKKVIKHKHFGDRETEVYAIALNEKIKICKGGISK